MPEETNTFGRVVANRDGVQELHYSYPNRLKRRWPIPLDADKLNLGCGADVRAPGQGWTNLDGFNLSPNVVKHDLAKTPWPFKSAQFDLVYASHVLEHIPLIYEERNGTMRDVLFAIMEEIHRVLKPGGLLHALVPYGGKGLGYCHPQHYRQWRPEWFRFFDPNHEEGTHYSTARFVMRRRRLNRSGLRFSERLPIGRAQWGLSTHLTVRAPRLCAWLVPKQEIEAVLERV